MDKANTLNQMQQYDFSTPINVTMIFEDSEDDSLFNNVLKEQVCYDDNKQDKTNNTNSNHNAVNNVIVKQKPVYCNDNVKENKLAEISSPIYEDSNTNSTSVIKSLLTQNNCIPKVAENIGKKIHQTDTDIDSQDKNIKQLLEIISENLIFIMKFYYNYCNQEYISKDAAMVADKRKQMDKVKTHFFDLSYSTVVSLILPQEKNENFINNFLNKTVTDANNVLQCKCERKHVDQFYNEMISWVKKKRDQIQSFRLQRTNEDKSNKRNNNQNRIFKEYLTVSNPTQTSYSPCVTIASQQLDLPAQECISYNYNGGMTPKNSVCIFSSGDPEREISININANTLENQTIQESLSERHESGHNYAYTTKTPHSPKDVYYQRVNKMQLNDQKKRNTIHHKSLPPPYYADYHHNATPNVSVRTFSNQYQIQKNIAQAVQNYQTHQNSNSFASPVYRDPKIAQMYNRQFEESLSTTRPIITSVTSLNPQAHGRAIYSAVGRCGICGKYTTSKCSKCNNYSYCSSLCQELDAGTHQNPCKHVL